MGWYRTGTVNVTNNSDVVVGTGTDWLNAAKAGDVFQGPDLVSYEILQIASPTSLRCYPAYRGPTSAAQNYAIIPTRSRDVETAAGVSQLINNYAGVRDNAGQGKFAAGAAGAPSLRGSADEDTGVNFPGDNVLQLIASGVLQLSIDAQGNLTGPAADKLLTRSAAEALVTAGGLLDWGWTEQGDYYRFSTGLQVTKNYTNVLNKASQGPWSGGINLASSDVVFPAQFLAPPAVITSIENSYGAASALAQTYSVSEIGCSVFLFAPVANFTYGFSTLAIGRFR